MLRKCFLYFLLLCGVGECGELVLLLNCDTEANNLEESVYSDLQNIRDEALRISHLTGMPIREISFQGYELNVKAVLNSLNSLKIKNDDVLIYYFSGHGYRTPSKKDNPWPYLFFSKSGFAVDYDGREVCPSSISV